MPTAYLSLGSNVGDRHANLQRAISSLTERGIRVVKQSSIYETEPVGFRDQSWFLNCAVEVETLLSPKELLGVLLEIEQGMGRRRTVPMGPRIIDIDILLYGDEVIQSDELTIPHPRMAERRFVLVPLAEIAPEAVHPSATKTAAQLLAETADRSSVRSWQPAAGK
jgi:2-amino-4-hydroxy-6-hydroxymethyldihydropteridine diphosphokinase